MPCLRSGIVVACSGSPGLRRLGVLAEQVAERVGGRLEGLLYGLVPKDPCDVGGI
jgi:hypothetical protein